MINKELYAVIDRYYKLTQQRKQIDDELRKLKDIIVDSLPDTVKIETGNYRVSISKHTQKRPDLEALKIYLGEKYKNFLTDVEVVRLTITKINEKGGDNP